ncbi:uncharacterized protein ARMOST_15884 [Armillaria ostoyae]|uniref:Uncharacterized protein n=1 Tax=Armillaria ostoyae TaxID=47428 RepID=A0A284RUN7_ARMOS|nr:uncharacterized protein ARMOST_15884 [Armillaria ostoyae]
MESLLSPIFTLSLCYVMATNSYRTSFGSTRLSRLLLLIKGHNESILYGWAQLPIMRCVWLECLPRLVRWSLGDQFRRWDFLKRVLAIVVIGRLRDTLGYCDNKESLPQYDYEAYMIVANELPWLHEVSSSGSSSDGEPNAVEYSQVAAHPKFQEFLNSVHPSQEDVENAYSHLHREIPGVTGFLRALRVTIDGIGNSVRLLENADSTAIVASSPGHEELRQAARE